MQQSYAKSSMVIETLDLTALIEDALRMNEAAFGRHGVRIVREYQIKPRLPVDRHRLLQVLMNLLSNAKYAMEGPGPADKRLTVRVRAGATRDRIAIEVIDVGVGIAPENLSRIFSHGFTTRKGGHGFGLHSSATALNEVGASLTAHSDGVGRGATFRIELPVGQEAGV
jgi:signal transduction histidine kinase